MNNPQSFETQDKGEQFSKFTKQEGQQNELISQEEKQQQSSQQNDQSPQIQLKKDIPNKIINNLIAKLDEKLKNGQNLVRALTTDKDKETSQKTNNSTYIFQYITKWKISKFYVENFQYSNKYKSDNRFVAILKEISHIKFSFLSNIHLSHCNIDNLQPLTWLQANKLSSINIQYNNITSLKPLIKLMTKKLFNISFNYNPLHHDNLKFLSRTKRCNWFFILPTKFSFSLKNSYQKTYKSEIFKFQNAQISELLKFFYSQKISNKDELDRLVLFKLTGCNNEDQLQARFQTFMNKNYPQINNFQ